MPVFLDHLIDPFYRPIGPSFRHSYQRDQVFFAPIGYARENVEVWRPQDYDVSRTSVTRFSLVPAPGDRFAHATPLHTPRLETNEEFLGVRAKIRPVVLLAQAPADPGVVPVRGGGRVHRRLALVVPVFSLVNRYDETLKYPVQFVERMRMLAYDEFLYLPTHPGVLRFPSYARIGEVQPVYQPHLDARDLRLADEALAVLQGQMTFLTTARYVSAYSAYREQLLHQS